MSIEGQLVGFQESKPEANNYVKYRPYKVAIYVQRVRRHDPHLFNGSLSMHVFD